MKGGEKWETGENERMREDARKEEMVRRNGSNEGQERKQGSSTKPNSQSFLRTTIATVSPISVLVAPKIADNRKAGRRESQVLEAGHQKESNEVLKEAETRLQHTTSRPSTRD